MRHEEEGTVTAYDPQSDSSTYRPPVEKSSRTLAWGIGRAIVWIVYVFAVIAIVIATIAFVLQLFGADPSNEFAQWIYRSASRVTEPFRGIFPTHVNGNSVVDVSLLFAIIMYALFALLVNVLIDYIDRRRDRSISRDRYDEQQAALRAQQPR
jgi:YggT family protein